MIDFNDIPVIDNHCHLFDIEYTPRDLAGLLSMSLNDMPPEQLKQTLIYRSMIRELRGITGISGPDRDILASRENLLSSDYRGYVQKLFTDANIHTLLVDIGYKPAEVSLENFEELVPADVKYIYRLESCLDPVWESFRDEDVTFREAEDGIILSLEEALSTSGIIGLKSIIGYRTGLNLESVDRSLLLRGMIGEKEFRDYFVRLAIKTAAERNLPIQIHAAFGESNIDVLKNNPALLKGFLEEDEFKDAKIILVHGGYPYCFEAAYLASVFPNVYVDISEMVPFAPRGAKQGLDLIFDMCPFNKVLYGSDGFVIPDIHWLGAKTAKRHLASLFTELENEGLFDQDMAEETARMVFYDNAKKLYGL